MFLNFSISSVKKKQEASFVHGTQNPPRQVALVQQWEDGKTPITDLDAILPVQWAQ